MNVARADDVDLSRAGRDRRVRLADLVERGGRVDAPARRRPAGERGNRVHGRQQRGAHLRDRRRRVEREQQPGRARHVRRRHRRAVEEAVVGRRRERRAADDGRSSSHTPLAGVGASRSGVGEAHSQRRAGGHRRAGGRERGHRRAGRVGRREDEAVTAARVDDSTGSRRRCLARRSAPLREPSRRRTPAGIGIRRERRLCTRAALSAFCPASRSCRVEVSGPSPRSAVPKPAPAGVQTLPKSFVSKSSEKRCCSVEVGNVLRIWVPGRADVDRCSRPSRRSSARPSAWSVAATQITLSTAPAMPEVEGSYAHG